MLSLLLTLPVVATQVASPVYVESNVEYTVETDSIYNIAYNDTATEEEEFPPYKDRRTWNRYVLYLGIGLTLIVFFILFLIFRRKIARWWVARRYLKEHPEHKNMTRAYVLKMAKVRKLERKTKGKIEKGGEAATAIKTKNNTSRQAVQQREYVHNITKFSKDTKSTRKGRKEVEKATPQQVVVKKVVKPTRLTDNVVNKKPVSMQRTDVQEVTRRIQARLSKRKVGK